MSQAWIEDTSGAAADTGSALHRGAAVWHQTNRDTLAAVKALRDSITEYPLADLDDAERQFQAYALDPCNIEARVIEVEKQVAVTIDPAPFDPTREEIVIHGTLDQIRLDEQGTPRVWDIKTSARDIASILNGYTFQLAAYTLAASKVYPHVQPGGFIRTRTYTKRGVDPRTRPLGVFINICWTIADCDRLLDAVRHQVALIRGGRVHLGPGEHCNYCPARGVDACLPMLQGKGA